MEFIYQPWPWYSSGMAIALVMLLLQLSNKKFGMSSNLRTLCSICGAGKHTAFFRFNWRDQKWNLTVVLGAIIGGYIAANFMTDNSSIIINENTIAHLKTLGFESAGSAYLPTELFGKDSLFDPKILTLLFFGGLFVGFGARYAGGCTSGHAISGLSNLQLPSLIAVFGFFIGGFIMIHLLFPLIF